MLQMTNIRVSNFFKKFPLLAFAKNDLNWTFLWYTLFLGYLLLLLVLSLLLLLVLKIKVRKIYFEIWLNTFYWKISMYNLNLLNIINIFVFDDETALENAKLTILERLEWQIFLQRKLITNIILKITVKPT